MKKILRKIILKLKWWKFLLKYLGEGSFIAKTVVIYNPENIEIGEKSIINEYVLLNARTALKIGANVHISPFVIVNTGGLEYKKIMEEREHFDSPVVIEDGVWIGSGAIINPGVKIGSNSVIGAGAVVTSDIPENSVAVGVPAKVIKKIND
jgi:galactoside O-acetyltransferase